mgnify:CR=1 FL=1
METWLSELLSPALFVVDDVRTQMVTFARHAREQARSRRNNWPKFARSSREIQNQIGPRRLPVICGGDLWLFTLRQNAFVPNPFSILTSLNSTI